MTEENAAINVNCRLTAISYSQTSTDCPLILVDVNSFCKLTVVIKKKNEIKKDKKDKKDKKEPGKNTQQLTKTYQK